MKKVLIGCAIATLLVIVTLVGGTVFVVQQFKRALPDPGRTEAVQSALLERDGPLADYVPPLDGTPSAQSIEGYVQIMRAMSAGFERDGRAMSDFVERMGGESNPLRKLIGGVRGGVDMTRAVTHAEARVDSLMLKSGLSEGELAYVHALHRYGLMKSERPEPRFDVGEEEENRKAAVEIGRMLREVEEQIEAGLRQLLERQSNAISSLEDPAPEMAPVQQWLNDLLDARSTFEALRENGLLPAQEAAFASYDLELRELAAKETGAYFLECITFGIDDGRDGKSGGMQFSFGD